MCDSGASTWLRRTISTTSFAAKVEITTDEPLGIVDPNVHGHFIEHIGACVYGGIWDEDGHAVQADVVAALAELEVPLLRWPGGCFADDYHWRDGIGPVQARPRTTNLHWGGVADPNSVGTHEFIALCRAIGAEPYLCGNVGSGSPTELRDWMEYCNGNAGTTLNCERAANGSEDPFAIRWWGVGNENWGCGGNMAPEQYGAEYARYATYLPGFGTDPLLVACGPNGNDVAWSRGALETILARGARKPAAFAAHYYTWNADGRHGSATEFDLDQWHSLIASALAIEDLLADQCALLDTVDPECAIALAVDEWGVWHPADEVAKQARTLWLQQNSIRDAVAAALTLHAFQRRPRRVRMACLAQAVNVLHSVVLADSAGVTRTPTWHVYDLFRPHKGGTAVQVTVEAPTAGEVAGDGAAGFAAVDACATLTAGTLCVTLVNASPCACAELEVQTAGPGSVRAASCRILGTPLGRVHAHNRTGEAETVVPAQADVQPGSSVGTLRVSLWPASVARLLIDLSGADL